MSKTYQVEVTLKSISPLEFSFKPDPLDIDSKGVQHVKWKKGKGGMDFKFTAVAFHSANPFSSVVVGVDEINAADNNHLTENHIYGVLVKVDRTYYNSRDGIHASDGPTIRNK